MGEARAEPAAAGVKAPLPVQWCQDTSALAGVQTPALPGVQTPVLPGALGWLPPCHWLRVMGSTEAGSSYGTSRPWSCGVGDKQSSLQRLAEAGALQCPVALP